MALETQIARLQGENATLKKELLACELPVPGYRVALSPTSRSSSCRAMARSQG